MTRAEILKDLGLDRLPDPRIDVPDEHPPVSGSKVLSFKKAMQTIDPIETAAFEKYIPSDVVIDQSIDAHVLHPELTKGMGFRTDIPIPSSEMIQRATGIGHEQTAPNQYKWLAQCLKRHYEELGVRAISPPLVFRWALADPPVFGCIIKVDPRKRYEGAGASWALLSEKKATKIITENDEDERLMASLKS